MNPILAVNAKRGRGAYNKAIVFGILERNGKVYTAVFPNVKAETLLKHIKEKTKKGSVYYTDTFRSYNSLIIYGRHEKIDHSKTLVEYNKHINGIEGFWSFAKERFMKYHGINRDNYYWYLKEMEFRFNYRNQDLFKLLVQIIFGGIGPKRSENDLITLLFLVSIIISGFQQPFPQGNVFYFFF